MLPGTSPCGRTNIRIRGWMGRADQTTKVKGMFVHPEQVAAIARRHPEIGGTARRRQPGRADRMMLQRRGRQQPLDDGRAMVAASAT